jgi:hypothetical protein
MGDAVSDVLPVANGTPQGTLLGPMFWLLYVDSLSPPCHTIKYADDLTVTSADKDELQHSIDYIADWCVEHNMIANANKSVIMSITNRRSRTTTPPPNIKLNNVAIPIELKTKFLGVIFDHNLTFEGHVDHIISRVRPLIYVLLKLKRSGIPTPHLGKFYNACIVPRITYASPVWYSILSAGQKDRLVRLERIALRIAQPSLDCREERLCSLGLKPIEDRLEDAARLYMAKCKKPNHPIYPLLPSLQSKTRRHSTRLKDQHLTSCRTSLRSATFIHKYCNA